MNKLTLLAAAAFTISACTAQIVQPGSTPGSTTDAGTSGGGTCSGDTPYCVVCSDLIAETCDSSGNWVCPDRGVACVVDASMVDTGIWPDDASIPDASESDGGCPGDVVAVCAIDCGGETAAPSCVDGMWTCPASPPCAPDAGCDDGGCWADASPPWDGGWEDGGYWGDASAPDASVCFGEPPSCLNSCGDVTPAFCDGSGNWACMYDPGECYGQDGGIWVDASAGDAGGPIEVDAAPPINEGCPAISVAEAGGTCIPLGTTCYYPKSTCICSQNFEQGSGVGAGNWMCTALAQGCPEVPPTIGTRCSESTTCNYGECLGGGGTGLTCENGVWQLAGYACPL